MLRSIAGKERAVQFTETTPGAGNYWRGIVLFGRNSATYKFALARSLIELALEGRKKYPSKNSRSRTRGTFVVI